MDSKHNRRQFLQNLAVAGGLALAPSLMAPVSEAHAATAATPPLPPKVGLTMAEVLRVARDKLYPRCRVCPECNGVACAGEIPGFGGIGTGASFKNNYEALQRVRLHMRVLHNAARPDLRVDIFGAPLIMPVLAAPMGGVARNMGGKMHEEDFINAILGGCMDSGVMGMTTDTMTDPMEVFSRRMDMLKGMYSGKGIVMIKPRAQEDILARAQLAAEAGALAFGVDVDSAARSGRAPAGQRVEPKTGKQLQELVKAISLPLIVKGIMTVDDAKVAVDAGAQGIVVSNHGGRVLDSTPGVAEVLPEISRAVRAMAGPKVTIFADGAVRSGVDVLKLLALGADICLMGRPLIRGAHGAGKLGVSLMLNAVKRELGEAMVLTGVANLRNVPPSILAGV